MRMPRPTTAAQMRACPPRLVGYQLARVKHLAVQDLVCACSAPNPDRTAYLAALLASVPERAAACDERRLRAGAFVPRIVAQLLDALGRAPSQPGLGSEPGVGPGQAPAGVRGSSGAATQQGESREPLGAEAGDAGSQPAAIADTQGRAGPAVGPAAAGTAGGAAAPSSRVAGEGPGERAPGGGGGLPPQGALDFAGQLLTRLSLRGSAALVARALWAQLASQSLPGDDSRTQSRSRHLALRVSAALAAVEEGAALERLLEALLLEASAGIPADPAGLALEGLRQDAVEAAAAGLAGMLLAPCMLARHTAVRWGLGSAASTFFPARGFCRAS